MKEKIIKIVKQIFLTHMGRLLFAGLLMIIGGLFSPNGSIGELLYKFDVGTTFWDVLLWIGAGGFFIQGMIWIVYGLLLNPIKKLIEKFKK